MKDILLLLVFVFSLSNIFALCTENQIDINTASLEELDKLMGIGPAKAQEIVNSRPFTNVDDLIKVKGIGEVTLADIKSQGLACVSKSAETQEQENEENETSNNASYSEESNEKEAGNSAYGNSNKENLQENQTEFQQNQNIVTQPQVIKLDSKNIKSDVGEINNAKKYATYGLIIFTFFLALLFAIRKNKKKNEIV